MKPVDQSRTVGLPAHTCAYHREGHCLYQEHLNPGYAEHFRCVEVRRIDARFDEFVDRAEAFALSPEQVGSIWNKRFGQLQQDACRCDEFVRAPAGGARLGLVPCARLFGDVCLLRTPVCEGRCRYYSHESPD